MKEPFILDGLSPAELYVLGTSVDITYLFGLPEPEQLSMLDDQIFEKAKQRLQKKKLLTESGALTKQANILIELLKIYAQSAVYVRINRQMIAFRKPDGKDLIVLTEQDQWRSYRLELIPKSIFVIVLFKEHPFLRRKPTETEHKFLLRKLSEEEEKVWSAVPLDQTDLISMEWMPRENSESLRPYSHFLYLPIDDELYRTNVISQQTRKVSLFYLFKELFDWLNIPYGGEAHV
ncbi:DUF5081 family protein [Sporolactobacillus shoreicorticis]|uniref:DUF5081 family protein n=1 Tax=Sporolactobacillus shoreicorticis TaxID=1923877 RepID=A0ABW5S499_9BACL|nr:DUF5081 family protein [Sporolactobacillus shoreicorticis]MCO7127668.1 DUF5081 family protein [Sporolactobacillus shoreicorticis]